MYILYIIYRIYPNLLFKYIYIYKYIYMYMYIYIYISAALFCILSHCIISHMDMMQFYLLSSIIIPA